MLLQEKLKGKKILLASKSPRRHYLLKELDMMEIIEYTLLIIIAYVILMLLFIRK
jgi:hypothetical protein